MVNATAKCALCEKNAIGIQIYGCCAVLVCADHADPKLLELKPGEVRSFGDCYFRKLKNDEMI